MRLEQKYVISNKLSNRHLPNYQRREVGGYPFPLMEEMFSLIRPQHLQVWLSQLLHETSASPDTTDS